MSDAMREAREDIHRRLINYFDVSRERDEVADELLDAYAATVRAETAETCARLSSHLAATVRAAVIAEVRAVLADRFDAAAKRATLDGCHDHAEAYTVARNIVLSFNELDPLATLDTTPPRV